MLEAFSDRTLPTILTQVVRLATRLRSYNMVVTNVPGPASAAYLLGARLLEVYPMVPLSANQGVGVALVSYAGGLFWGINADWDSVPDLHDLLETIVLEFEELRKTTAEPVPERRECQATERQQRTPSPDGWPDLTERAVAAGVPSAPESPNRSPGV